MDRKTCWSLAAAWTVAACGGEARPSLTAVADSAGVAIVTNLPGSAEAAGTWTLSADPVVEIGGGLDPDQALYRITAVTPLANGRVVVGMNTPPQAMVFEANGTLAATLGRPGEGPGEFSGVGSVVRLGGDSVAVWDPRRRRMSVFTTDGRLVREVDLGGVAPVSAAAAPDNRANSGFVHLLSGGSGSLVVFGEGLMSADAGPGVRRPALPARRISADGELLAELGAFPGMEVVQPDGFPRPLGKRTYAAMSGDRLVVGTADTTEVRVYGPDGDLARIVRWPDGNRAVAGPFLERWSALVEGDPTGMGQFVEALPRAERFPAYMDLLATEAGEILVGEYPGPLGVWSLRRADDGPEWGLPAIPIPARRWLVFDTEGALSATLSTPRGFEPYALRQGLLWGVYTDSLQVESVRAYELSR